MKVIMRNGARNKCYCGQKTGSLELEGIRDNRTASWASGTEGEGETCQEGASLGMLQVTTRHSLERVSCYTSIKSLITRVEYSFIFM